MPKTLWIGRSSSAVCYYRVALPASALGHDWIGIIGQPEQQLIMAGSIDEWPNIDKYDCFILQQVSGPSWLEWIKDRQKEGKKVIYEIDDFIHGIKKIEGHNHQKRYTKQRVKEYIECLKQCDGAIYSTDYLASEYNKYNDNSYVCLLGVETERYSEIEIPKRTYTVCGWAGGTGHAKALLSWAEGFTQAMEYEQTLAFSTMGAPFALELESMFPNRCLYVPWVSLENFPHTLSNFDINLAPFHDSKYFKAKSDLRFLQAAGIGLPSIAHPAIYSSIKDKETGFLAESNEEVCKLLMELSIDTEKRETIGKNAQEWVQENADYKDRAKAWDSAINSICQA